MHSRHPAQVTQMGLGPGGPGSRWPRPPSAPPPRPPSRRKGLEVRVGPTQGWKKLPTRPAGSPPPPRPAAPLPVLLRPPSFSQSPQAPESHLCPSKGPDRRACALWAHGPQPASHSAFCLTPLIFHRSCLLRDPRDGFPPSEVSSRKIKVIYAAGRTLPNSVGRLVHAWQGQGPVSGTHKLPGPLGPGPSARDAAPIPA